MKLAELNVGYAAYPLDDPRMADFMNNLDRINALAERSPGFVWRMKSDSGNATDIAVPGDATMISNMSVWEDVESLGNYVFNTVHARLYERAGRVLSGHDSASFRDVACRGRSCPDTRRRDGTPAPST